MTIQQIMDVAVGSEGDCHVCGAKQNQPCIGTGGVHLCRIACACKKGKVPAEDFASLIPGDGYLASDLPVDKDNLYRPVLAILSAGGER